MTVSAFEHTVADPLHIYFCAWAVAGVRTQYENVRSVSAEIDDVDLDYIEIDPSPTGGLIDRLPMLNERTRGSLRSLACTWPLFTEKHVDGLWTQADTALFLFLATRAHLQHIPYVLSTDATTAQVESFPEYGLGSGSAPSLKHRLRARVSRYCYRNAAYVLPWSQWAADAIMAEFDVPAERIRVVPPGIDLHAWPIRPAADVRRDTPSALPRLLFVGGDFARKGGSLLLDVFRASLRGRCELHLVTRDPIDSEPGIVVHPDLEPNDPRLLQLYQTSDMFVLPTRADCFSLACIEAMASGLPVITCGVGGIPEIVADGDSGWLVPVGDGASLYHAANTLLMNPACARQMGQRGRAIVEQRFDASKNTRMALDLLRQARLEA